jgi:hypothetical protein
MGRWFVPAAGLALLAAGLVMGWQNHRALEEVRSLVGAERARLDALVEVQQRQLGATAAIEQSLLRLGDRASPRAGTASSEPAIVAAAPTLPETAGGAAPAEAPTPESQAAALAARELVETAVSKGHWTQQDHVELLRKKALMPPGDYQAAMQRLIVAINAGKISVDDPRAF